MDLDADLIHTVVGVPNHVNLEHDIHTTAIQQPLQPQPPQPELEPQQLLHEQQLQHEQQEHGYDLEFQKSPATTTTPVSFSTQLAPAPTASIVSATKMSATMPPEIIHLILYYLDNRDLVKVITLNWTWAHWAAPRLWSQIDYTVQSSRIFFLITKSVAPPSPDKAPSPIVFAPSPSSLALESLVSSSSVPPLFGAVTPLTTTAAGLSQPETGFTSIPFEGVSVDRPPPPKRRRSYPWPTLLPYHTMVHTLNVSLSTADMVQDLLELIPCCTELESFALHSAIPTEDLLIRGVIASSCNDTLDPLNSSSATAAASSSPHRASASSASLASMAQGGAAHTSHSHAHSLSLDPYNSSANPRAGLQEGDDETIMASSTSQSGKLLKLLSQSCPKLEKIWFSGFHPVSVLGTPTDLRPRPSQEHRLSTQLAESLVVQPPVTVDAPFRPPSIGTSTPTNTTTGNASLPPIPPVPGINSAVALPKSASPAIAAAAVNQQLVQSKIHSVQFVNCTLPPQYLLTMIQHSLPNLTELALTQCWKGNPLTDTFLTSVVKVCPGLKEITLHATQNHRDSVTSENLLKMLQGLEGRPKSGDEEHMYYGSRSGTPYGTGIGGGASMADFPLGTFRKTSYTTTPSISSTAATVGQSSMASHSSSASSPSSTFVTIPTLSSSSSSIADSLLSPLPSPTSASSSYLTNGSNSTHQGSTTNGLLTAHSSTHHHQHQSSTYYQDNFSSSHPGSDLESISVWFTHSTLDQSITAELANRARHPRLRRVEFGSEDAFDVGEDLIRQLGRQREEVDVTWVSFGDTGDDRDD